MPAAALPQAPPAGRRCRFAALDRRHGEHVKAPTGTTVAQEPTGTAALAARGGAGGSVGDVDVGCLAAETGGLPLRNGKVESNRLNLVRSGAIPALLVEMAGRPASSGSPAPAMTVACREVRRPPGTQAIDDDGELALPELGGPGGITEAGLGQQLQQEGDVEECQSPTQDTGLLNALEQLGGTRDHPLGPGRVALVRREMPGEVNRQRVRVGGDDVAQPLDIRRPWIVRGCQCLLNELDVGVLTIEAELGQQGVLARVAVVAARRCRRRPCWRPLEMGAAGLAMKTSRAASRMRTLLRSASA